MAAERARSVLSRIPLGRALVALALVLVAINVASAIWDARKAHQRTEERALRDLANITRVLAEQTAASLEAVDVLLRDMVRTGGAQIVAKGMPRLTDELARVPTIAALVVVDDQGRLLGGTTALPDIDAGAQRFFTVHRFADTNGLHLSEPFRGGAEHGPWRFVLSRRLNEPDRRFGGVVAAAIEIEAFDRLYRAIDLGEGSFIALVSTSGVFYTRVPHPAHISGRQISPGRGLQAVRETGRFEGWTTSPVTGERILLSALLVRGFPLFVASGRDERAVFAPWREEAWLIFDRTVLTSAAMLSLIGLAAWGLARRERALQGSWKRYQAMIEHSSDALILTRPTTDGIVYASPAIERLLGYTLEDLRGREVMELVHPEQQEEGLRLRAELMRTPGKVSVDEARILHKDGSWRWIEFTRSNLLHEPSVRAIIINFRDITERKQAEAERLRLEQRLAQAEKLEAVGRLAGGIAHDFNNILGGILGYAELLAENAAPGSPLKRYADNVLTGANRAGSLVEQILSYSRSQRGKRVPVALAPIVAETVELVRGSLPRGVELRTGFPAAPLHVLGDPTQLHQVTMNLCTNAVHAMGESGTLRVGLESVDVTAPRALAHTTLAPGGYVCLTVEDTGTGMDQATLARVFEPFFTTKEVGKGTGLGLALVYGIVIDSGGGIDVESAPGQGSRFSIYLPRVDAAVVAADDAAGPVARGQGERVLVVDDEEALVAVASEALKRMGYAPIGCADGNAALAAFEAAGGAVDAVVADEVMPGLTGTQLARALRKRRPDLPILLVSGYTGPLLRERALGAGITEVLKKPVHSRELAAALARALRRA